MTRLHAAVDKARSSGESKGRLRDVVARLGENALPKLFLLLFAAMGTDKHAVAAGFADGLDDVLVKMAADVVAVGIRSHQEGFHVVEDGIFAEVIADHRGYISVNGLVVGDAGPERIGQNDIARAVGVEDAGRSQSGVAAERQGVEKVVVDAAIDD